MLKGIAPWLQVSRPGIKRAKSFDLGEDRFGCCHPGEGAGSRIVRLHEGVDLAGQLLDAGERVAADGPLRDEPEPALDLVDPGGVGGDAMQIVAGPAGQC